MPAISTLIVTDHAVLRYMQRVQGFDVELVRQHILKTCSGPHALKATAVRAEGVKFEISGDRVVSVVPDNVLPGRTSRENSQTRYDR